MIFGNSGSGKSTLAKEICEAENLSHLDLDTLAWQPTSPPERKPIVESEAGISTFTGSHQGWVIEGCYSDLIEIALPCASEIIFMNLSVEDCIKNAKKRPWEPHKYESKEAQDINLEMLIQWITRYPERDDTCSALAHTRLYNQYEGKKRMHTSNERSTSKG